MWPRLCEIALGIWLLASPMVLEGSSRTDLIIRALGALVILFSGGALAERFRRAYLLTFALSLSMVGWALLQPSPASGQVQNLVVTGLLLAMFAILPPETTQPPREWRRFEAGRDDQRLPEDRA